MTTHATGSAIEAYRAVIKAQWKLEAAEATLEDALARDGVDIGEYFAITRRIDQAIDEVDMREDLAPSTLQQRRNAALQTGRQERVRG